MPRTLAILLAFLAAAVLAACGSEDEQPTADAGQLLSEAFRTPVESGKVSLTAELQVDGLPGFGEGIEIRAGGPFTKTAADLDVSVGGLGPGLAGGFTVTEDNAFVTVGGRAYELGEEPMAQIKREFKRDTGQDIDSSFADLGIDVAEWIEDPRVEGEEEVAGTTVTKVSGSLDAARVLEDLEGPFGMAREPLALSDEDREQLAGFAEDARLDVYVHEATDTIRRVTFDVEFEVPEDARGRTGGAEGGAATIDVTFSDIGEPQRIEPPDDARPLDDLLRQFGLGAELFLQ